MTIASAFNEITAAQGGTPDNSGTIAGAVDALADALAGEDVPQGRTIEDNVRLLGDYIGGGGPTPTGTIEIDENGTYDVAAYASANVDVSSAALDIGKVISLKFVDTRTGTTEYNQVDIAADKMESPGTSADGTLFHTSFAKNSTFTTSAASGLWVGIQLYTQSATVTATGSRSGDLTVEKNGFYVWVHLPVVTTYEIITITVA